MWLNTLMDGVNTSPQVSVQYKLQDAEDALRLHKLQSCIASRLKLVWSWGKIIYGAPFRK